jgi:hypothetical protein
LAFLYAKRHIHGILKDKGKQIKWKGEGERREKGGTIGK